MPATRTVRRPAARAAENTVGTAIRPLSGRYSSQVIPWAEGVNPDSIEACDGSVVDGRIVCACHV